MSQLALAVEERDRVLPGETCRVSPAVRAACARRPARARAASATGRGRVSWVPAFDGHRQPAPLCPPSCAAGRRVSRAYNFGQPLDFEPCDSPDYASVLAVRALLQILLQLPNATLDCSDGDSDATTATDDDFGICSLSLVGTPKNSARGRKTVDKTVPFARESLTA